MRDLRYLGNAALELIWPTRCAGCEKLGALLCETCTDELPFITQELACPRCGAPAGLLVCTECAPVYGRQDFAFSQARCAVEFSTLTKRLIVAYKDKGDRRLAFVLALILAHAIPLEWRRWADAISWIPADEQALRRRGFDHMALIAHALAEHTGLRATPTLVKQVQADQRVLSRAQRSSNMTKGFSVIEPHQENPPALIRPHIPLEHLILIDDVFTTGATLDAAARMLLRAKGRGIREVRVATISRVW
jgi:predicted amidophosphoribosyltransferase